MDQNHGTRNGISGYTQQPNGWWTFTYPENKKRQFRNWADWFLAAEDEEESCLGRTRSMVRAKTLSPTMGGQMLSIATHIAVLWNQYLENAIPSTWEYLLDTQGLEEFQHLGTAGFTEWTWAGIKLAAEGKRFSLAFAVEVLASEEVMDPKEAKKFIRYLYDWAAQWRCASPTDEDRDQQLRLMRQSFAGTLLATHPSKLDALCVPVKDNPNRAARRAAERRLARQGRRDQQAEMPMETFASFALQALTNRRNSVQLIETREPKKLLKIQPRGQKLRRKERPGSKLLASLAVSEMANHESSSVSALLTEPTESNQDQSMIMQDDASNKLPAVEEARADQLAVHQGRELDNDKSKAQKTKKARHQALKRQAERREKRSEPQLSKLHIKTGRSTNKLLANKTTKFKKHLENQEPSNQDAAGSSGNGHAASSPLPPSLEGVVVRMARKAAPPPGTEIESPYQSDLSTHITTDEQCKATNDPVRYGCSKSVRDRSSDQYFGLPPQAMTVSILSDEAPTNGISPDTASPSVTATKPVSSLSWQEMGLAAEETDESLFGRARQLALLGALSDFEADNILSIGIKVAEAWQTFNGKNASQTETDVHSTEWQWSDLQLDAEDREDSILGAMRLMAKMGLYDKQLNRKVHDIGTAIAKKWLIASSTVHFDEETFKCGNYPAPIANPTSRPETYESVFGPHPEPPLMKRPLNIASLEHGRPQRRHDFTTLSPVQRTFEWQLSGFGK